MDRIVRLGIEDVKQLGASLIVRLPGRWLAEHELEVGSPVFSVLTLDDCIRVHLTPQTWTTRSRVRKINGRGHMTLMREYVDNLGLKKGDKLSIDVDLDGGILLLRRA